MISTHAHKHTHTHTCWIKDRKILNICSDTLANWCEELTHLKRPWCWERLKAGGEGDDRGWDGWLASPTQWTWVWVNSGRRWWTGLACCGSWGHKELDMTEQLDWTELIVIAGTWLMLPFKSASFPLFYNYIYIYIYIYIYTYIYILKCEAVFTILPTLKVRKLSIQIVIC